MGQAHGHCCLRYRAPTAPSLFWKSLLVRWSLSCFSPSLRSPSEKPVTTICHLPPHTLKHSFKAPVSPLDYAVYLLRCYCFLLSPQMLLQGRNSPGLAISSSLGPSTLPGTQVFLSTYSLTCSSVIPWMVPISPAAHFNSTNLVVRKVQRTHLETHCFALMVVTWLFSACHALPFILMSLHFFPPFSFLFHWFSMTLVLCFEHSRYGKVEIITSKRETSHRNYQKNPPEPDNLSWRRWQWPCVLTSNPNALPRPHSSMDVRAGRRLWDQLVQTCDFLGSFGVERTFRVTCGKRSSGEETIKGILELFWLLRRKLMSWDYRIV